MSRGTAAETRHTKAVGHGQAELLTASIVLSAGIHVCEPTRQMANSDGSFDIQAQRDLGWRGGGSGFASDIKRPVHMTPIPQVISGD